MDKVEQVARELEELLTDARQLGYMYDTSVSFSTLDRAIAALRERAGAVPDGVRHLVGKLDQWRTCMSYNESYFGEPAGLVKAVSEELARAVDPIYPPKPEPVDPLAGVTIRTATVPLSPPPSPPVEQAARGGVEGGAWTESDMERPWGAESAFLRHLADDPALNLEQSAMLRHCAKRIESTAGIHLRALADMLNPAKQAGVLREAADALPLTGERHG